MIGDDDIKVLLDKFEGWTFEKHDLAPPPEPMNVIRLRAPDGRVAWVALCSSFGLGAERGPVTGFELKPGHRLLARIERAGRAQAVAEIASHARKRSST